MPDRVPVTFFIVDQGHFITQVYPGIDPYDHFEVQRKTIEIQKQLGVDVFARMVYDINPYHIHFGGVDVSQETESWEVRTQESINGDTIINKVHHSYAQRDVDAGLFHKPDQKRDLHVCLYQKAD